MHKAEIEAHRGLLETESAQWSKLSAEQLSKKDGAKQAMVAHNLAVKQGKPPEEIKALVAEKEQAVEGLKKASVELFKAAKSRNRTHAELKEKEDGFVARSGYHEGLLLRRELLLSNLTRVLMLNEEQAKLMARRAEAFNYSELTTPREAGDARHNQEASGWKLLQNATNEFETEGGLEAMLEREATTNVASIVTTLDARHRELLGSLDEANQNLTNATARVNEQSSVVSQLRGTLELNQKVQREARANLTRCECSSLETVPHVILGNGVNLRSRKQLVIGQTNDIGVMLAKGGLELHSGQSLTILSDLISNQVLESRMVLSADEYGDGDGTITIGRGAQIRTKAMLDMSASDVDFIGRSVLDFCLRVAT